MWMFIGIAAVVILIGLFVLIANVSWFHDTDHTDWA